MDTAAAVEAVHVTDMHTGGEPLRIITSGYPEIKGRTILEKRRYVRDNLDHYRTMLMHEPRGHYDQYGALIVSVDDGTEADIGVLFLHNEGYSTMCGHAVIALGRYIVDNNLHQERNVDSATGEVKTNILCPCGVVTAYVAVDKGVSGPVRFTSVPAFAFKLDLNVAVPAYGDIRLDIGYGGAFYALVDINQTAMDLKETPCSRLVDFATAVTVAVKEHIAVEHPEEKDLSFLYGTILTDGSDAFSAEATSNLCVFADRQVDRSPTGSGVTARLAVQFSKRLIGIGEKRVFRNSKVGSEFVGEVVKQTTCGTFEAVCVSVQGHAFYTGTSQFIREENDPLKDGLVVR